MKKFILLLLFIFLFSSISYSQRYNNKYYGSGGFGLVFPNFTELNNIIHHFNDITPNQSKQMGDFHTLFGPNFLIGMVINKETYKINIEFGFSIVFASGQTSEALTSSAVRTVQDVTMRLPTFNIGAEYLFVLSESVDMGPGFFLNLGSLNMYYRTYNKVSTAPRYDRIGNNNFLTAVGLTPTGFINFHLSKQSTLSVRPSYYFMLTGQNLNDFDNTLNGVNGLKNIDDGHFNGFGLTLNLMVKFRL